MSHDEYEQLAADARRIADRFVALFERYVVGPDPAARTAMTGAGECIDDLMYNDTLMA